MRRKLMKAFRVVTPLVLIALLVTSLVGGRTIARIESWLPFTQAPIRVGLLHSQTGPMAVTEKSLIDAEVMAIEEINAAGGLLGRRVEWVAADGKSDPLVFAEQAKRLIDEEKVVAIFGCWTAESRRAARAVVDARESLLFYPGTFEGIERSTRVVYMGGSANQTVIPAIRWCVEARKARRVFVIGSEELWSRCTAEIAKDAARASRAEVVGEAYLPTAGGKMAPIIEAIKAARPDFVINAVLGDSNEDFYAGLRQAGLGADTCPVIAFGFGEDELRRFPPADVAGHYAAMNYFQTIDRAENRAFVARFKARFGADRSVGDPIVASANGIKLWAQAVMEGTTVEPKMVLNHLERQSLDAPEGVVTIDAESSIVWRPFYLGRARADGQFDVVSSIVKPVHPILFVPTRSHHEWVDLVAGIAGSSGNRRAADVGPSPSPSPAATPR